MTKTQSSKFALAKYILFIPLVLMLLVIFSCQEPITDQDVTNQRIATSEQTSTATETLANKRTDVYDIVEEMPRFPGCENKAGDERKQCAEM